MSETDVLRLQDDPSIIRNRAKIRSAIQEEYESFDAFV